MKRFLAVLVMYGGHLLAQEAPQKVLTIYDPATDVIAENYEAGGFLMYDCEEKHWVCVLESYYQDCQEKRKADHLDPNKLYHSCAPLGEFPNKKSCFQRMLFMTSNDYGQRFCIKDSWKEKNVSY